MSPKINYALYGIDRYMNKERLKQDFNYEEYLKKNGAHGDVMKMIGNSGLLDGGDRADRARNSPRHDDRFSRSHSSRPANSMSRGSFVSKSDSRPKNNFGSGTGGTGESSGSGSGGSSGSGSGTGGTGSESGSTNSQKQNFKIGSRSRESEGTKKMNNLMARILRLQSRGIVIPEELIDPKNMGRLEMIVAKHEISEKIRMKLATASTMLKGFTWGVEKLSTKMGAGAMEGWSEAVMADQSSYNEVLEELHDKYLSDISSPEAKLAALLLQSAIMHTSGMTIIRLMADLNNANQRETVGRLNKRFGGRHMRPPADDDDVLTEVEEYSRSVSRV